ncbi:DUF3088 family protein [Veronia pacifica]|uniref:DUF3088 domain-containing protein n=1 Tax=Veronia pacifica TaxID=1080227 RepID=A0A1C3EQU5_9GAMM|nr:DUF3088 family protein [Veronia pacifica]ODA35607.1 hypothetical protein A8L45_03015 [Veronia pacifica]
MNTILFLLKRDFTDEEQGKGKFFCPFCLKVEGLMAMFPEIRHAIEVRYVDFDKPRANLADFVGSDNQSCPHLIFPDGDDQWSGKYSLKSEMGIVHIDRTSYILNYFIDRFDLPSAH